MYLIARKLKLHVVHFHSIIICKPYILYIYMYEVQCTCTRIATSIRYTVTVVVHLCFCVSCCVWRNVCMLTIQFLRQMCK